MFSTTRSPIAVATSLGRARTTRRTACHVFAAGGCCAAESRKICESSTLDRMYQPISTMSADRKKPIRQPHVRKACSLNSRQCQQHNGCKDVAQRGTDL